MPSFCPSWLHDGPVPAAPGHLTCEQHFEDEPHIIRINAELARVAEQIDEYEADVDRHPDKAKDFLESAIQWFLDQDLVPAGYRAGQGYRGSRQLDIITTMEVASPGDWSLDLKVRRRVENAPLAIHIEVAYRSTGSDVYSKVKRDLQKLNESIDQCRRQGRGLPWTALILLGPAWQNRVVQVMQVVHSHYHGRNLDRIPLAGSEWWPFIDAVVMPTVLYKKHDIFETRELTGAKWPTMIPIPAAGDRLRPLAIARGFLMHRLRVLEGRDRPEGEAWPDCQTAAISGSYEEAVKRIRPTELRAILMRCYDGDHGLFWHLGSAYPRPQIIPLPFALFPNRCDRDGRFLMMPLPHDLTPEEEAIATRLSLQDPDLFADGMAHLRVRSNRKQ